MKAEWSLPVRKETLWGEGVGKEAERLSCPGAPRGPAQFHLKPAFSCTSKFVRKKIALCLKPMWAGVSVTCYSNILTARSDGIFLTLATEAILRAAVNCHTSPHTLGCKAVTQWWDRARSPSSTPPPPARINSHSQALPLPRPPLLPACLRP